MRIDDLVGGEVSEFEAGEKVGVLGLVLQGAGRDTFRGRFAPGINDERFGELRVENELGGREGGGFRCTARGQAEELSAGKDRGGSTEGKDRSRLDEPPPLQGRASDIHG